MGLTKTKSAFSFFIFIFSRVFKQIQDIAWLVWMSDSDGQIDDRCSCPILDRSCGLIDFGTAVSKEERNLGLRLLKLYGESDLSRWFLLSTTLSCCLMLRGEGKERTSDRDVSWPNSGWGVLASQKLSSRSARMTVPFYEKRKQKTSILEKGGTYNYCISCKTSPC